MQRFYPVAFRCITFIFAILIAPASANEQAALLDDLDREYKRLSTTPLCPSGPPTDDACSPIRRFAQIKELAQRIEAATPQTSDEQMWRINKLRIETDLLATRVGVLADQQRAEIEEQRAATERARRIRSRGWPAEVTEAVIARRISIGMTREQVREAWGKPLRVEETTTAQGTTEWWWYGAGSVYFQGDVLKTIHRSSSGR